MKLMFLKDFLFLIDNFIVINSFNINEFLCYLKGLPYLKLLIKPNLNSPLRVINPIYYFMKLLI